VPIVADIHFHYKRGIEAAEAGAACLRINPGNIGDEKRVREVIKAARDHDCAIRIGVNAGSLEKHLLDKYGEPCPDAMVESGLDHIRILEDNDFHNFKISMKASDVFMTVAAYQMLAEQTDAPFHLGITEAGGFVGGTVKSAIGLGNLLWAGLGDTMRVSLSADPVEEVKIGFEILKSLGLRHRGVNIISCPSCARQGFDVIKTVETLEKRLEHIKTPMSLSIIGCVVNGPGEALDDGCGLHRRRRGVGHGLSCRQAEPQDVEREDDRSHRGTGGEEGRRTGGCARRRAPGRRIGGAAAPRCPCLALRLRYLRIFRKDEGDRWRLRVRPVARSVVWEIWEGSSWR
jgi:(E)-4-hydroxy-3-methylbut-2-enyl-diphosphate synthase